MDEVIYTIAIFVGTFLLCGILFFITVQREKAVPTFQPATSVGSYFLELEVIKTPMGPFNWDPFLKFYHTTFTIPVDKDYYNMVSVGEVISNQLSTGPRIFKESNCFWKVTVVKKTKTTKE
jgi:hypothetical protein